MPDQSVKTQSDPRFLAAAILFSFSSAFFVLRFAELGGWDVVLKRIYPAPWHPAVEREYDDLRRLDERNAARKRAGATARGY